VTGTNAMPNGYIRIEGTLQIEINGAAPGLTCDRLVVAGDLDLSATTDVLRLSGTLGNERAYTLATYSGMRTGKFDAVYWNGAPVATPEVSVVGGAALVYGPTLNGTIQIVGQNACGAVLRAR
jgi:hypothetical protein